MLESHQIEISLYGTLFNFKPHPTNSQQIISIGNDHDLSVWDVVTRDMVHKFKGTKNSLTDAAFTLDGKVYAYASNDGVITVTDQVNQVQVNIQEVHDGINAVPISVTFYEAKDTYLIVGTSSKDLIVFKIVCEQHQIVIQKIQTIQVQCHVDKVAWPTTLDTYQGNLLVFQTGKIDIWNLNGQEQFQFLRSLEISTINSQILSYDSQMYKNELHIALGDGGFGVTLIKSDLKEVKILFHFTLSSAVLKVQLFYLKDQLVLACGTLDPGIHLVNDSGEKLKVIENRAAPFLFCLDGSKLIARSPTVTRIAYVDDQ